MRATKVIELMTENPVLIDPNTTLQEAALKMRDIGCGILPVGIEDKLAGIITDRDIVIRAVARGMEPAREQVRDYMTDKIYTCDENDTLQEAADKMRTNNVSRLIVEDRAGRVTGIITFGAILRKDNNKEEVADVVRHATRRAA